MRGISGEAVGCFSVTLEIIRATDVLQHNPLVCRAVFPDKRELVIGRSARGYVALYRHIEPVDTVFVLAIRGHREAGYERR